MYSHLARLHTIVLTRLWLARGVTFGFGLSVAALVASASPHWLHGVARSVAAYDAGAIATLAMLWTLNMHVSPQATRRRAAIEDPGRNVIIAVVLGSVLIALASAISILARGPNVQTTGEKAVVYTVGTIALAVGFCLIHTMFALRYAHLYYHDGNRDERADRGLLFPGTENPNDYDFAYFSFVVGMTFQVSDVQITDAGMRRIVLLHGIISFAYNTLIIALAINIVSGLLH